MNRGAGEAAPPPPSPSPVPVSPLDFYDALAPYYHFNYADWEGSIGRQGRALRELLSRRGVAPQARILDAACGIGTQSLGLAMLGYRVRGSDLSGEAVERARREAAARGLDIEFSVADLRRLGEVHAEEFDAVIACDNALPHLLTDDEILTAFREMYGRTAPGGHCLISVRDYAAEEISTPVQARAPLVHSEGEKRRVVLQVWASAGERYELSLYVIDDDRRADPTVRVMRTHYYAISIAALMRLMTRAGFQEVERYDEPFFQPVIAGRRPIPTDEGDRDPA